VSQKRRFLQIFTATVLTVVGIALISTTAIPLNLFHPWQQSAIAQERPTRLRDLWQDVYQQVPDLPLENQYVNRQTRGVDESNTLVGRIIRYHLYVKNRPPSYRLDWKLTLADYLDANEIMEESNYPSADVLRENPMESDKAAVKRLTRRQRTALVDSLTRLFTQDAEASPSLRRPGGSRNPNSGSSPLPASQPGGAELLRP